MNPLGDVAARVAGGTHGPIQRAGGVVVLEKLDAGIDAVGVLVGVAQWGVRYQRHDHTPLAAGGRGVRLDRVDPLVELARGHGPAQLVLQVDEHPAGGRGVDDVDLAQHLDVVALAAGAGGAVGHLPRGGVT